MGQVEGKLDACDSRVENEMAKYKTTVNTPEETFTTWESRGKEVKPIEITGYRHDKSKLGSDCRRAL
jgi:hypothetical protein